MLPGSGHAAVGPVPSQPRRVEQPSADRWLAEFKDGSTLATWLDPTYRTGLIGKYFNAYQAPYVPPGWNEWAVPRGVFNYFGSRWVQTTGTALATNVAYPGYQTATLGALSVDFIQRNAPSTEPFFMYTSIVAPHSGNPDEADDPAPYPTPAVEDRYRNDFAGLANNNPSFNEADVSDKPIRPKLLTPTQVAKITEVNAQRREAELSAQDQINRILDALKASGEMADTYVMFMSDNGYILGEHRTKIGKIAPYQPSNRVPFMVRGPGIPAGGVVDDETAQVDFAPTVLAMAGAIADDPADIDGLSLLPQLTNPTAPLARPASLLEATQTSSSLDPLPWQYHGVVSNQWKYIERESGTRELYDLDADPDELENVADRRAYVDVQTQLAALLDRYRWCAGAECR